MSFEVVDDTILRIQRRGGQQIVYLAKRTQTPIYEVPENLPLAQGAHIRFQVKRSVLGYKFVGVEEHTPKPPQEPKAIAPVPADVGEPKRQPEVAALTLLPIEQLSGTLAGLERVGEDPELEELAESAKERGILQPVIAMLSPGTKSVYLVVAGNRRVKAARKAGLSHVPAIVRPYSLEEAYEFSLIENIQRKDLSDYEKGRLLKLMLSKFPGRYPSHEALAKRIGKSKTWVTLHIGAHETAEDLRKDETVTRVTKPEELSEKQLRELRKVPEEERPKVLEALAKTPVEGPHEKPLSARKLKKEALKAKGLEDIDTGVVWTCSVCKRSFTHIHHADGKHSLQEVTVA